MLIIHVCIWLWYINGTKQLTSVPLSEHAARNNLKITGIDWNTLQMTVQVIGRW